MTTSIDYTADMRRLAGLVTSPDALDEMLRGALRNLAQAIPYDLAVVFELEGDELVARSAAGPLASDELRSHRLPLARFPTVREALHHRRPIALREHDHRSDEGDPFDGVLDLPHGHSCMVVPLFADRRELGIITLDRAVCEPYSHDVVELAGVYGQLISIALAYAEQAALLHRYRAQLEEQNRLLRRESEPAGGAAAELLSSRSPVMRKLVELARHVAATDVPVLLEGETGAGKEVLAAALHEWSPRRTGPFVKLNCATLPENLVESELFGHVKGAYSGATADRAGRFKTANGGTLLLDEIGDMPLPAQAKLLRVLQEGTFEPVGADKTVKVDVRVVASTNIGLREAVDAGRFREDLYYRLAVFPLSLPPLRERREDVAGIALAHLEKLHVQTGRGPWVLLRSAEVALARQDWPGNVRQLLNCVERATILRPAGELGPRELGIEPGPKRERLLPGRASGKTATNDDVIPRFHEQERAFLERVLRRTGGRVHGEGGAAALLDLAPTTLQSKLKKHGIDRATFCA